MFAILDLRLPIVNGERKGNLATAGSLQFMQKFVRSVRSARIFYQLKRNEIVGPLRPPTKVQRLAQFETRMAAAARDNHNNY
jgi:hypothetical protein